LTKQDARIVALADYETRLFLQAANQRAKGVHFSPCFLGITEGKREPIKLGASCHAKKPEDNYLTLGRLFLGYFLLELREFGVSW